MAVVTFMSDYGLKDHYVAAVKATILSVNPLINIVDISHHIKPFDIAHGAYVLKNSYPLFPEGSVHLVGIDAPGQKNNRVIAVKLDGHYFVGRDNGLFSIISSSKPEMVIEFDNKKSTFVVKDILAINAAKLANGTAIETLGNRIDDENRLISRVAKVTKREIVGNVIRVDHYGNLITNIKKSDYEAIQKMNGNVPILIQFGREQYHKFHTIYNEVEPGDCYVLFNSADLLQIGLNMGNACELLGLTEDAPVYITFNI
jgi:hypothetical protein